MENQIQTPVNQLIGESVVQTEQQPQKSNFLVILLSILLTISVTIAGFFAYQTQKLVKEITTLRNVPTSMSVVLATPTSTPDITADWKTYTDKEYNFSFKYPTDFVKKTGVDNNAILSVGNDKYSFFLYINYMQSFYSSEIVSIKESFDSKDLSVNVRNLGSYTAYLKSEQSAGGDYSFSRTVIVPMQSDMVVFVLSSKDENEFVETENLADQILSTFKFTN